jgi:hypothetical protein
MEPPALLEALVALAGESGVAVRRLRSQVELAPALTSGPALVRGQPVVFLVDGEPAAAQAAALARALRRFAGPALDARYLAPALRAALDAAANEESR